MVNGGRLGGIVLFTALLPLGFALFGNRLPDFGRLHRPSCREDHGVHPLEVWPELHVTLPVLEGGHDTIQAQVLQNWVIFVGKLISGWWEADVLVSQHNSHYAVAVESVDKVEESVDKAAQDRAFGVGRAVTQIDAAEDRLLEQGCLVLPCSELNNKLLQQCMLLFD